jgi:hypothetical protein
MTDGERAAVVALSEAGRSASEIADSLQLEISEVDAVIDVRAAPAATHDPVRRTPRPGPVETAAAAQRVLTEMVRARPRSVDGFGGRGRWEDDPRNKGVSHMRDSGGTIHYRRGRGGGMGL